ncbi:MAG: ferritin-like domain-containing protein [Chitinophagaceae bacterium]
MALLHSALVIVSPLVTKIDNDDDDGISLGSGDTGILNYAYALEQLEAAFYAQVILNPFSGMTAAETALLTDIRDHEIAHREFFKAALAGNAIQPLTPDFSSITFTSRDSVLGTAKAFEDLGVSAYNGAGKLIVNPRLPYTGRKNCFGRSKARSLYPRPDQQRKFC